jgi:hypothetical protein
MTEEPKRVGVSLPSPEDGNRFNYRNVVFWNYIEIRTMEKFNIPSDSEMTGNYQTLHEERPHLYFAFSIRIV